MRTVIYIGVSIFVALWANIVQAQAVTPDLQEKIDMMVLLCGGSGHQITVSGAGSGEINVHAINAQGKLQQDIHIKASQATGLYHGINNALTQVAADEVDKVRKCLKPVRLRILNILFPPVSPGLPQNCPNSPGAIICRTLTGHHILDVLVEKPDTIWVLISEPVPGGRVIYNPDGAVYPTRKVSIVKITSPQDVTTTFVAQQPITDAALLYLDRGYVNVFLVYRIGDDADYLNAGTLYTFNKIPFEVRAYTLFKFKNWGAFPMFIDGHLKYFSYDGYYWVIDNQPDGKTTPREAQAEWKAKEAEKSLGVFPGNDDTLAGDIIDVTLKYLH